eukprot:2227631-Rhodomonas_salina.2
MLSCRGVHCLRRPCFYKEQGHPVSKSEGFRSIEEDWSVLLATTKGQSSKPKAIQPLCLLRTVEEQEPWCRQGSRLVFPAQGDRQRRLSCLHVHGVIDFDYAKSEMEPNIHP